MTQSRKDELFDRMLYWINEHIRDDMERFSVLHTTLGMTQEELHDCCIESLDEYFQDDNAVTKLKEKLDRSYDKHRNAWLKMPPQELLARCEEIEAVTRMAKELPKSITEEDAAYLLRFVDPLEVVSDAWADRNGAGSLIIDSEIRDIVWQLADTGNAELDYAMEPVAERRSSPKGKLLTAQER